MSHESFEDKEVAEILNASFVSIKVDREERPDIDEVYMSVCQAMTGGGGWPLTIIMTPEKKPFFAGTYLPKETAYGRIGLIELLEKVASLWRKDREELEKNSEEIIKLLSNRPERKEKAAGAKSVIKKAYGSIANSFDEFYGGFSQSPKFPTPHNILFLLSYWKAYDNYDALDMAEKTLGHMYRGGIFDHVGWGFSRYSTDRKWLVPHFEKMLYDNALLLLAYTECFAATGGPEYRGVAEKTAEYLLRGMRSPEGGFYSAEDADSEGVEGKYYVWSYDELKGLLTGDELKLLEERYGVTRQGNFEGANILNMIHAKEGGGSAAGILDKLYKERQKRIPPFKDTKVSASWNGFAIEALARAGCVFGREDYIDSARKAADFILSKMRGGGGGLSGTYKDGLVSENGFLADYANMCGALVTLYTSTLEISCLREAITLAKEMLRLFWDEEDKRFYMTAGDGEFFMRPRDEYDGAMPSGNSGAVMCLLKIYNLTGAGWARAALDKAIDGFLPAAAEAPTAYVHFLSVMLIRTVPHRQVVISADKANKEAMEVYKRLAGRFMPFTTIIYYDRSPDMDELIPELAQYKTDTPFAGYVCENFTCRKPVYSTEELLSELGL